jgi:hypothetical protein
MKTCLVLYPVFFSLVLAAGITGRAEPAPVAADAVRELTIVVVDSLGGNASERNTYDRIAQGFTEVLEAKKWPLKINVERFGANAPAHPLEMRVYFQGIHRETPDELTFRAWVTLSDHGAKSDFGVIRFSYSPRPMELTDDRLDNVVRGAARIVADKIEPILFPKAAQPKP